MAGQIIGKPPRPGITKPGKPGITKPTAPSQASALASMQSSMASAGNQPSQSLSARPPVRPPIVGGGSATHPIQKPPMTGGLSSYKPAGSGPMTVRPPVVYPGSASTGGRVPRTGASLADHIFQNTRKKK